MCMARLLHVVDLNRVSGVMDTYQCICNPSKNNGEAESITHSANIRP